MTPASLLTDAYTRPMPTSEFTLIASADPNPILSYSTGVISRGAVYIASGASDHLVGAVLAQADGVHALVARDLIIHARTSKTMDDAGWHELSGGACQCGNCSRVGLEPTPPNMNWISVNVDMEVDAGGGNLYITTFAVDS